jgi:hypothetical protein
MGSAADALNSYRLEIEGARERRAAVPRSELTGVHINRITVRESSGDTPLLYESGSSLVLELDADVATDLHGKPLQVQFTVDSELGDRVQTLHSSWAEASVVGETTINVRCTIDAAYLAPGRYFISGWVFGAGEYLDHIERAVSFEIAPPSELLDPKRLPAYGPVVFPHRFEQLESASVASIGGASAGQ